MQQPHPIDVLHEEHRILRSVLDGIAAEANRLRMSMQLRADYWLAALQFLEHFADRMHDEKEEQCLFPALERTGMGREHGPLPVLRQQHEQARVLRARMLDATVSRDIDTLVHAALDYCRHVAAHVEREEKMLFPLGLEALDETAAAALSQAFATHDQALGPGQRERCLLMADALANGTVPQP